MYTPLWRLLTMRLCPPHMEQPGKKNCFLLRCISDNNRAGGLIFGAIIFVKFLGFCQFPKLSNFIFLSRNTPKWCQTDFKKVTPFFIKTDTRTPKNHFFGFFYFFRVFFEKWKNYFFTAVFYFFGQKVSSWCQQNVKFLEQKRHRESLYLRDFYMPVSKVSTFF